MEVNILEMLGELQNSDVLNVDGRIKMKQQTEVKKKRQALQWGIAGLSTPEVIRTNNPYLLEEIGSVLKW